jgi:glutamate synthase domain-containing protein 3
MSGGEVYVYDPENHLGKRLNGALVAAHRIDVRDAAELRRLVERHLRYTGSRRAEELLERWDDAVPLFWRVAPKAEVAQLESAAEGTTAGKASA